MDIEKPKWEYAGTFDAAWEGVDRVYIRSLQTGNVEAQNLMKRTFKGLSQAHVITLDVEQFNALPTDTEVLTDYVPDPHLPFQIMYISTCLLSGILLGHTSEFDNVAIVPFWGFDIDSPPGTEPADMNGRINMAIPIGVMDAAKGTFTDWLNIVEASTDPHEPEMGVRRVTLDRPVLDPVVDAKINSGWTAYSLERALSVVRFLESANVDFEDTPVSRQVRRQAGRKGTPISQRVYVRSPRQRNVGDRTEHGHIDYSHRFEVRGHYKHYGPDTRLFKATLRDRPHKVINHPKIGQVVRIWCPDFIKGPPDRPLVPKTRVYRKTHEDTA